MKKDFITSDFEPKIFLSIIGLILIGAICSLFIRPDTNVEQVDINKDNIPYSSSSDTMNNATVENEKGNNDILNEYTKLNMSESDLSNGNLVLINNNNLIPSDDTSGFTNLYDNKNSYYYVASTELLLNNEVVEPLNNMFEKFREHTGIENVNVASCYRSFDTQQGLYQAEIEQKGEEEAGFWVAKPGGSEHHIGLAIDFSIYNEYDGSTTEFSGQGEYAYLDEIAPEFGFIVRYQDSKKDITNIKYEPWHFRYVGIPHSLIMRDNNLCFEEYIDYLKDFSITKKHLFYSYNNIDYEIYYCKGYDVYVPKDNQKYEISGNNCDGFIVTVIN